MHPLSKLPENISNINKNIDFIVLPYKGHTPNKRLDNASYNVSKRAMQVIRQSLLVYFVNEPERGFVKISLQIIPLHSIVGIVFACGM